MQVNQRWHPDAFATLDQGFDPAANVDYAARFLLDLHQRTGDWMTAAGSYHSFNDKQRNVYLAALKRNLAVANAAGRTISSPQRAAPVRWPRRSASPRPNPQPKTVWSSALSAGADGRHLSIYSTSDLQPILPQFTQEF